MRWSSIALLIASIALGRGPSALAAPPTPVVDIEPEALAQGLIARFDHGAAPGVVATRRVADLAWHWGDGSPDARISADGFRLEARGFLLVQAPGPHRVLARTDGLVTIRIGGRVVAEGRGAGVRSEAVELRAGFATIEVAYRHEAGPGSLAVDWEGPGFAREPIPARLLFHDPATAPRPDLFEEGRRLADRLGCANCHAVLELPRHPTLGPPLDGVASAVDPGWLDAWLRDPTAERPDTRMPAMGRGLSPAEAADLAAFLSRAGPNRPAPSAEVRMGLNVATPEQGRLLFRSRGCLGCHAPLGAPAASTAPDLAAVVRKRSAPALAAYLEHPRTGKVPSRHRPDLRLTADESAQLAAYLTANAAPASHDRVDPSVGSPTRGRELADRLRCAACHVIPGLSPGPESVALRRGTRPDAGCLAEGPGIPGVPRFALEAGERLALRAFVSGLPERPAPSALETRGLDALRRRNCLGCHGRDAQGGLDLASRLAPLLAEDPALGGLKGTLTPPNLTAVGDKLRPEYLRSAVRAETATARPWLSVRMPAFPFEPGEDAAIVAVLRLHDRMDPAVDRVEETSRVPSRDRALGELGARLIGQRGFGCLSCHVLNGRVPPGGEPETLGPDLALAHSRMTERYFQRWLADPQRILAGTPMPQFLKPVAVEGAPPELDAQLGAVWALLGSPALPDLAATGTREVLQRVGDRALVVRDMILLPGAPGTPYTPRGLAIGLDNGASLLFDADRLTWLASWQGGFAYRTKAGRLWEWHPDGQRLWTAPHRLAPLAIQKPDGTIAWPTETRERLGSFREVEFQGKGVVLRYRLDRDGTTGLDVAETIQPAGNGWTRSVLVRGPSGGDRPLLVEQPPDTAERAGRPDAWRWSAESAVVTLRIDAGEAVEANPPTHAPLARFWRMTPGADGSFHATVRLEATPQP